MSHVVLQVLRPAAGGMLTHAASLCRVMARDEQDWQPHVAAPGSTLRRHPLTALTRRRPAWVHPLPIADRWGAGDAAALFHLQRLIRRLRPRLVHAHGFKASVLSAAARLCRPRVPLVATVHGFTLRPGLSPVTVWLKWRAEGLSLQACDRVIAVSAALREELLTRHRLAPQAVRVIPNGVDIDRFSVVDGPSVDPAPWARAKTGLPCSAPVVGTVGRFVGEKGLSVLIAAVRQLVHRWPDLRLCLVGDGPLRPGLERRVRRLGWGRRVVFAGYRRDVRPWLAAMSVFVQPSLSEGGGLAALEAMALGRPVVVSRTGGLDEAVPAGAGLRVPPGDPAALAAAVDRCLRRPRLAASLARRGRRWVAARHCRAAVLGRIITCYRELLDGRATA